MFEVSYSYSKYKFIGNEFLTWLLFLIRNGEESFMEMDKTITSLEIGNRIVMENIKENDEKIITIRGNGSNLEEGMTALRMGAVVSEMNLKYKRNDQNWQFTIKGESLSFYSAKCSIKKKIERQSDIEGAFLEKIYLCNEIVTLIDGLFKHFIKLRISNDWTDKTVKSIKLWIKEPLIYESAHYRQTK